VASNNPARFPDYVIIGAAKSGTSTLFRYLEQHPGIFVSDPKEPCYFDLDESWGRGEQWYAALFSDARPDQLCGEGSTNYTRWPQVDGVPQRMKALIPNAKLIYLMRDPITRSYSHFVHRWSREVRPGEPFTESFSQFVAHDPMCLDGSDYTTQVARFLDYYPRKQLLLLTFEELASDPRATLRQVFAFLGVEDISPEMELERRENDTRSALERRIRNQIISRYRRVSWAGHPVSRLLPKGFKEWFFHRLRESKAGRRTASQFVPPPMTAEERAELLRRFAPQNVALRDAYGVDIGAWSS
jgi:hypothetical protein